MEEIHEYCKGDGHHRWESMGYGDRKCAKCGVIEYSESEEDFHRRIYGDKTESENGYGPKNDIW